VQAPFQMQNHCCAPSLYIKVLEVDGRGRLLFFARHDIAMGQVQR
jgi:SET domain-containing protein